MSEYYEYYRSGKGGYQTRRGSLDFPPHFHQNIELCVLLSGEQELCVGGRQIHATSMSVTVVDNFVVHSFGKGEGERYSLIIPHDMLTEFNRLRKNKSFGQIYVQDATLAKGVADIINNCLQNDSDYYMMYSAFNMIMSLLLPHLSLTDSENKGEGELINRILTYAQDNYKENITLESAARALGYAEGHLSRVFHKYVSESFPRYVNRLRYEYVQNKLYTDENITKLIFDAGFRSIQTYYRTKALLDEK